MEGAEEGKREEGGARDSDCAGRSGQGNREYEYSRGQQRRTEHLSGIVEMLDEDPDGVNDDECDAEIEYLASVSGESDCSFGVKLVTVT